MTVSGIFVITNTKITLTYAYDYNNRLTFIDSRQKPYDQFYYDDRGNVIDNGYHQFTYNHANHWRSAAEMAKKFQSTMTSKCVMIANDELKYHFEEIIDFLNVKNRKYLN